MYGILNDSGEVIVGFTAPLTIKSNQPAFSTDTLSLHRFVSVSPAQRWEITCGLEPQVHEASDLMVHLVTKGYSTVFEILCPQNVGNVHNTTFQNASGSTVTVDAASANATQVYVRGGKGLLKKGRYIRFAGASKVYMTTTDLTDSGLVGVFPPLRNSIPGSTALTFDGVRMRVTYDLDVVSGMSYRDGILMDIGSVKLIEAL